MLISTLVSLFHLISLLSDQGFLHYPCWVKISLERKRLPWDGGEGWVVSVSSHPPFLTIEQGCGLLDGFWNLLQAELSCTLQGERYSLVPLWVLSLGCIGRAGRAPKGKAEPHLFWVRK